MRESDLLDENTSVDKCWHRGSCGQRAERNPIAMPGHLATSDWLAGNAAYGVPWGAWVAPTRIEVVRAVNVSPDWGKRIWIKAQLVFLALNDGFARWLWALSEPFNPAEYPKTKEGVLAAARAAAEREAKIQSGRLSAEPSEPDITHVVVKFHVEHTLSGERRAHFSQGGFPFRSYGGVYYAPVWQVKEDFGVPEWKDWSYTAMPYWSGCGSALEFRLNRPLVLYWGPQNVLMAIAKFEPGAYEAMMAQQ